MDIYRGALDLASTTKTKWLSLLLLASDSVLCGLIIWKIPCGWKYFLAIRLLISWRIVEIDTEIDWIAYMQQVKQYLDGVCDYTMIKGDTGPLVYPAAHLYIYSALYRITDGGKDILAAQIIFAALYLGVLSLVMACYTMAKVMSLLNPLTVPKHVLTYPYARLPPIYFRSLFFPNVFIVSFSFDSSMIALPLGHCSYLCTHTSGGFGLLAVSHTHGRWALRWAYF